MMMNGHVNGRYYNDDVNDWLGKNQLLSKGLKFSPHFKLQIDFILDSDDGCGVYLIVKGN